MWDVLFFPVNRSYERMSYPASHLKKAHNVRVVSIEMSKTGEYKKKNKPYSWLKWAINTKVSNGKTSQRYCCCCCFILNLSFFHSFLSPPLNSLHECIHLFQQYPRKQLRGVNDGGRREKRKKNFLPKKKGWRLLCASYHIRPYEMTREREREDKKLLLAEGLFCEYHRHHCCLKSPPFLLCRFFYIVNISPLHHSQINCV